MVFLDISPIRSENVKWKGRWLVVDFWSREDWKRLPMKPSRAVALGPLVVSIFCKARDSGP